MLSKIKIKLIKSLDSKKKRNEAGLFVAEGNKLVAEIIESQFKIRYIVCNGEWFDQNKKNIYNRCKEVEVVSENELNKISYLKTPQNVLCLAEIPQYALNPELFKGKLSLILDNIQDPGNLGTILRIADWFGIEHVICSDTTADVYNPKVIQATMGAICRVKVYYENLEEVMLSIKSLPMPIYGTSLVGENIYNASLKNQGFIVMGNESKGISPDLTPLIDKQLMIPFYPENQKRSESLNVAIATAIICSEFRRR